MSLNTRNTFKVLFPEHSTDVISERYLNELDYVEWEKLSARCYLVHPLKDSRSALLQEELEGQRRDHRLEYEKIEIIQPDAVNPAMASRLQSAGRWRAVTDPER